MATVVETALARRGRDNQVLGTGGKPLLVIVEGEEDRKSTRLNSSH